VAREDLSKAETAIADLLDQLTAANQQTHALRCALAWLVGVHHEAGWVPVEEIRALVDLDLTGVDPVQVLRQAATPEPPT
jgi:hypothetical protein